MQQDSHYLSIGEVARRSGVATSALRYYESRGLIHSQRVGGNHRRYHRATLRRISIIRVAQNLGLSLSEISDALASLPAERAPTKRDWTRLSTHWGRRLDQRIACGCLSLQSCALYNADDQISRRGPGPRYLLGDQPDDTHE